MPQDFVEPSANSKRVEPLLAENALGSTVGEDSMDIPELKDPVKFQLDSDRLGLELTEESLDSIVAGKKKSSAPSFLGRFKENLLNFLENK
jgi:hypothetical protein